jgi:hypothetical protein
VQSLQRAFASGAVGAGLALVASFWVPPFSGVAEVAAGEAVLAAEIGTLGSDEEFKKSEV